MTRVLWLVVAALLISSLAATPVKAQVPPAEFAVALQAGQSALQNVQAALQAGSPAVARDHLRAARPSLQQAVSALQTAEDQATDDSIRSRAEGLRNHFAAALAAVDAGIAGPDSEVASRADAARGEIEEALAEFPPVPELPRAGGLPGSSMLLVLAATGATLLATGRLLRQPVSRKLQQAA